MAAGGALSLLSLGLSLLAGCLPPPAGPRVPREPGTEAAREARSPAGSDAADSGAVHDGEPRGTGAPASAGRTPSSSPSPRPRPSATALPVLSLSLVADGFEQPLLVLEPPGLDGRRFVVEKAGRILSAARGEVWRPWLDLRSRVGAEASEQGLLGLAFHPAFAVNGRFFVNYTDTEGDTVVSEFRRLPGATTALSDSERVLLRIAQPAGNHNGGHLAFGPDGTLMIASGDGGGGGAERAQQLDQHLGKLLRIDVDRREGGKPYGIPPDNPWAEEAGPAAEVWALGLRNPWRFSFDAATGDLTIGDVGASSWETIHREDWGSAGGRNYGWPRWEGFEERDPAVVLNRKAPTAQPPILAYAHGEGDCAVTGGLVYRGTALPWLRGRYVYADYCSGRLWAAAPDPARRRRWQGHLLLDSDLSIAHVGQDGRGELLLCDLGGGGVYRVVAPGRGGGGGP